MKDSPPEGGSPTVRRLRVLVVDDNRDSADTLAEMRNAFGHDTRRAHGGEEAVQVAAEYRPAVILLDIGMPKVNGYDVCRHTRAGEGGKDVVIIAQTGWGREADRKLTAEAGFDHHLVKPIDPHALLDLLASLSER